MTPAELKCARERLGLTTQWLADRWGVALYSVKRWETSRTVPDDLAADVEVMLDRMDGAIESGRFCADRVIEVPRTDAESPGGMPAAYHRAVAFEVARETGARLKYYGDVS